MRNCSLFVHQHLTQARLQYSASALALLARLLFHGPGDVVHASTSRLAARGAHERRHTCQ
jgi:hypothetical protein